MTDLVPEPELAEWLVELLDRFHPCSPECPCVLIEDNAQIIEVRRRRGPKPDFKMDEDV